LNSFFYIVAASEHATFALNSAPARCTGSIEWPISNVTTGEVASFSVTVMLSMKHLAKMNTSSTNFRAKKPGQPSPNLNPNAFTAAHARFNITQWREEDKTWGPSVHLSCTPVLMWKGLLFFVWRITSYWSKCKIRRPPRPTGLEQFALHDACAPIYWVTISQLHPSTLPMSKVPAQMCWLHKRFQGVPANKFLSIGGNLSNGDCWDCTLAPLLFLSALWRSRLDGLNRSLQMRYVPMF